MHKPSRIIYLQTVTTKFSFNFRQRNIKYYQKVSGTLFVSHRPKMGNTLPPGWAKLAKAPPPGLTVAPPPGGAGAAGIDWCIAGAVEELAHKLPTREIKLMVTTSLQLKSCAHYICICKQTIFTNLVISKVLKSHTRIPTSEAHAIERPLNWTRGWRCTLSSSGVSVVKHFSLS